MNKRPKIQWWPFRPFYIWRLNQYLGLSSRDIAMALIRDVDGTRFASDVIKPPQFPDDTWEVEVQNEDGKIYTVATRQIIAMDTARGQAGYD